MAFLCFVCCAFKNSGSEQSWRVLMRGDGGRRMPCVAGWCCGVTGCSRGDIWLLKVGGTGHRQRVVDVGVNSGPCV